VVVFDGMDNCKEMSVLFAGLEFAARGWNTLAIDGPGQGESLRLRGSMPLRLRNPRHGGLRIRRRAAEVDPQRVVIMGYSFGGYYAARIAAFEKRYCAGVAMSALHWDLAAWREVKRRHETDPKTTPQSSFHFRWIMGARTSTRRSSGPTLLARGSRAQDRLPVSRRARRGRQGGAVASAHKLFDAIGASRKSLRILTRGREHVSCASRQPASRIDCIADWIVANL